MPRIRPRHIAWTLAGGACIVLLAALVAASGPGNQAGGRGSTFSSAPEGSRAAYLTLLELGYTVQRSQEPLTALGVDPAQTVLVLASPQDAISDQDVRALREFLEAGGIVLATGAGGLRALGGDGKAASEIEDAATFTPVVKTPLTAGAPSIRMAREVQQPPELKDYTVIYGSAAGPAVMDAVVGNGHAIWWAGSTPLTNASISAPGNFELLLNALGDGTRAIVWDEHYHGFRRSLWSYTAGTPLPWMLAQCGVLAAAALLTWSRRLGPLRPRAVDPRTAPMEFIETVGGLYERAHVEEAAVETARRRLRRLLATSAGLSTDTSDDRLAHTAAPRAGLDPDQVAALLRDAADAAATKPETAAAVDMFARLQAASAAVLRAPSQRWSTKAAGGTHSSRT